MNSEYASQVMDGVMLSDGKVKLCWGKRSINPTPVFELAQTGTTHVDWLEHVREALAVLGTSMSDVKEYVDIDLTTGIGTYFCSHVSDYIRHLRKRWYPDGKKLVPSELKLTPVTLSDWFTGDGLSSYDKRPQFDAVTVRLCSQSFSREHNLFLTTLLGNLGILTTIGSDKGLPIIYIRQSSVDLFMDLVEQHVVLSYQYKVKRRGDYLSSLVNHIHDLRVKF